MGAKFTVNRRPYSFVVCEGEGCRCNGCNRHQTTPDLPGGGEHVQPAGADLRHHIGIASQLAVGENFNAEFALRLPQDISRRKFQSFRDRMRISERNTQF